jgi:acyl carrier protein
MTTTLDDFRAADAVRRASLAEQLIVTWVRGCRPGEAQTFDGGTRLSDLAIDSIQLVELKFALEQLVGAEIEVGVFIANPTVRELAEKSAAAGAR